LHNSRKIGGKPSKGFRGRPHSETVTELVQIYTGQEAPPALAKIAAGNLRLTIVQPTQDDHLRLVVARPTGDGYVGDDILIQTGLIIRVYFDL
jgi:hypothetical protein